MVLLFIVVLMMAVAGSLASARVVRQYERGLIFRFGRLREATRGPCLTLIVPILDRLQKVNLQIITMPVPAQDGITRDNVIATRARCCTAFRRRASGPPDHVQP